jgi:hypothetical protein
MRHNTEKCLRETNFQLHSARHCQLVYRTPNPATAPVEHMGVDHRGADILVPQEFLHGANIIAIGQ